MGIDVKLPRVRMAVPAALPDRTPERLEAHHRRLCDLEESAEANVRLVAVFEAATAVHAKEVAALRAQTLSARAAQNLDAVHRRLAELEKIEAANGVAQLVARFEAAHLAQIKEMATLRAQVQAMADLFAATSGMRPDDFALRGLADLCARRGVSVAAAVGNGRGPGVMAVRVEFAVWGRDKGLSWRRIGQILGDRSQQAAMQMVHRHKPPCGPVTP